MQSLDFNALFTKLIDSIGSKYLLIDSAIAAADLLRRKLE